MNPPLLYAVMPRETTQLMLRPKYGSVHLSLRSKIHQVLKVTYVYKTFGFVLCMYNYVLNRWPYTLASKNELLKNLFMI